MDLEDLTVRELTIPYAQALIRNIGLDKPISIAGLECFIQDTSSNITKLHLLCLNKDVDVVLIKCESIHKNAKFIKNGFIPLIENIVNGELQLYDLPDFYFRSEVQGVDDIDILIKYGFRPEEIRRPFSYWKFCKVSIFVDRAIKNGYDIGLSLYANDMLKKDTFRDPLVRLRCVLNIRVKPAEVASGRLKIGLNNYHVYPVISQFNLLNRWYYYTVSTYSNVYISCKKPFVIFNNAHLHSVLSLSLQGLESELLHYNGVFKRDLLYTTEEYIALRRMLGNNITYNIPLSDEELSKIPTNKSYYLPGLINTPPTFIPINAIEIIVMLGFDSIVFTHLPGRNGIEKKFLDLRSIITSYTSLIYA